jgi:hypothetical protein
MSQSRSSSQIEDSSTHAMILGEMRGQLRELVHSQNNLSAKFDGLSREVIGLAPLATDIADMKLRLKVLEERGQQQRGAASLIDWAFRNWPGVVGFVVLLGFILKSQGKL